MGTVDREGQAPSRYDPAETTYRCSSSVVAVATAGPLGRRARCGRGEFSAARWIGFDSRHRLRHRPRSSSWVPKGLDAWPAYNVIPSSRLKYNMPWLHSSGTFGGP